MGEVKNVGTLQLSSSMKMILPRLVPFFKMQALFFVMYPKPLDTLAFRFFKCAPVVCLIFFIMSSRSIVNDMNRNLFFVISGLFLSVIGDYLIVSKNCFIYAMCAFGLAHIAYINSFGIKPYHFKVLLPLTVVPVYLSAVVLNGLATFLGLSCLVYTLMIQMMLWRGLVSAYYDFHCYPLASICRCIGVILFCVSDLTLAHDLFWTGGIIPHAHHIIMITYYTAQMFIAASVDSNLKAAKF